MSYLQTFLLIIINALRVFNRNIQEKTERIFPEFKSISKYYIFLHIIFQILFLGIILFLDPSQNFQIDFWLTKYEFEFIMFKYLLELAIISALLKFEIPKGFKKFYGLMPSIFFIIVSNFKYFYSWVLVQLVCYKIFQTQYFFVLFSISVIIISISLFLKTSELEGVFKRLKAFKIILVLLLVLNFLKTHYLDFKHEFSTLSNNVDTLLNLVVVTLLVVVLFRYLCRFIKPTTLYFMKEQFISYIKMILIPLILLTLIRITSSLFIVVDKIEVPLVLISFLLSSLLMKIKFIKFSTIEAYGYYLFYIKSLDKKAQVNLMKSININNLLLILPVLLVHMGYLIQESYIVILLLLLTYILDIQLDELIILITRKILRKIELTNLFVHTKKGLSNVILMTLIPMTIISIMFNNGSTQMYSIFVSMAILITLIIFCVSILVIYWRKSFFDDLYK
ncbi:hypothetical protein ACQKFU_15065 [Bacillus mycoides]|uniref:hypothetical protein n=1 Tax=Bacillus mycoides TaxID=1405 RepID=UPI003D07F72C